VPELTDQVKKLLDRLRNGDQAALAELFSIYRDHLRRMVTLRMDHRLKGRVSPSDILQEAYLDAAKRVSHFFEKPEQSFYGWLRLIVGQRLVDSHREHIEAQRRNAGMEVSLHGGLPTANSHCLAAHLVADMTSPSHAAMRHESLAQLEGALAALEPLDREVLALRHFEELTNNEVAELLGLTKATASKRYVRALARLKDAIAKLPGLLDEASDQMSSRDRG
jgi:RNA polymerase sigma-70 factor (ECF subfamily)